MSWDVDLGHKSWNYTHNVNGMIERALAAAGKSTDLADTGEPWWATLRKETGRDAGGMGSRAWWDLLSGQDAKAGAALLRGIVLQLLLNPDLYREMNPENGWGDYDSLVLVLTEMAIAGESGDLAAEKWRAWG